MNVLLAIVAAVLAASAFAKLASPRRTANALGWILRPGAQRVPAMLALVVVELALAAALALAAIGRAPEVPVAVGVAALCLGGALALAAATMGGRAGQACGCFGARGRIGWPAVGRNVLLAGLVLAPLVPPSTEAWLMVGVGLALAAAAVLAVALLGLAREVGELRLAAGADVALELADEGPPLGVPAGEWPHWAFGVTRSRVLSVAVFTSHGCAMCARLEPAVAHLAKDRGLELARFDEAEAAEVWRALSIPGSPFAIVADPAGIPLAKGTFNSLAQLESLVGAAARRRSSGRVPAAA